MSVNFIIIGKRVKEVRKQKNLSQAELAEMADLSTQYLSQVETAKKKASLQSLINISNSLEVSLDELLTGNQVGDSLEYHSDIDELMKDCTSYEKRVIYEFLCSAKKILRDNQSLIERPED